MYVQSNQCLPYLCLVRVSSPGWWIDWTGCCVFDDSKLVKRNDHKPSLSTLNMLQFLLVFLLKFYIERAAEVGDIKSNNCTSCRLERRKHCLHWFKEVVHKLRLLDGDYGTWEFCVMEDILLTIEGNRGWYFKGIDGESHQTTWVLMSSLAGGDCVTVYSPRNPIWRGGGEWNGCVSR